MTPPYQVASYTSNDGTVDFALAGGELDLSVPGLDALTDEDRHAQRHGERAQHTGHQHQQHRGAAGNDVTIINNTVVDLGTDVTNINNTVVNLGDDVSNVNNTVVNLGDEITNINVTVNTPSST